MMKQSKFNLILRSICDKCEEKVFEKLETLNIKDSDVFDQKTMEKNEPEGQNTIDKNEQEDKSKPLIIVTFFRSFYKGNEFEINEELPRNEQIEMENGLKEFRYYQ